MLARVLITGAAGFLGSHLVRSHLESGSEVIGVDNLSTGMLSNLAKVYRHPRFRFMHYDVTRDDLLRRTELDDVREIYHLASPASPRFYQADPFGTIAANTTGTRNMLELARRSGASLVYSSTSECYGDPLVHPQPEEYRGNVSTWGPRACYDEAKRLGEVYCYEYRSRYGLPVKVARIFNTYSAGLRNDDGRVISNFVTQALAGSEITVYGDGTQTRSFCYVDDTVRGLRLLMDKEEANGEIINIGSDSECSILDLARLVRKLSRSSSPITFHPLPLDDPKVRRPSIGKAYRVLGWKPEIDLSEGLRRTIQVYRRKR